MELLQEKTADAGLEKHVPVVETTDKGVKVKVGSTLYPMEEKHYIEWIEVITDGDIHRKFLKPGDKPEAEFEISPQKVAVREYCSGFIRQDIAAELDAVALYQAHIDATDDERAKKVLAHARDDEKEHVGEFLALLEILDPQQAEYIKKVRVEIAELLERK